MKTYRKASQCVFTFLFAATCALSCSDGSDELTGTQPDNEDDQEEVEVVTVSPVSNLKAKPTYLANELQLSWTMPGTAVITEISWWAVTSAAERRKRASRRRATPSPWAWLPACS